MPADTRWIASASASALHLAECLLEGSARQDTPLAEAVGDSVAGLGGQLSSLGVPPERFFAHAIPLAARSDAPRHLAEVALRKLLGPNHTQAVPELARELAALFAAFRQALPSAVDELELRSGPLRDHWEARGPGLLAALARLTEPELLVDAAEVILVQPVLGGGGAAHPRYNAVHLEAVLTNAVDALPEIVRLGWLWAHLQLDLPRYEDHVGRDRVLEIGPVALVPPVLAAAEVVELARCDRQTLGAAIEVWRLPEVDLDLLLDWWATYQATSPSWSAALGALDQLLSAD